MRRRVGMPRTRCYTRKKIGPVVMVDEVSRCGIEIVDKRKTEGMGVVPTLVPNPSEVGGLKVAPETGKGSPRRNVGIVAKRATRRVSARKNTPIRTNSDPVEPNKEINIDHTKLRAPKEPEMGQARPDGHEHLESK